MFLNETHLTFGDIADIWARENADYPGSLNRDQILGCLKKALRYGEFNFATLMIDSASRDVLVDTSPGGPPSYVRIGPSRLMVTRGVLDKMLFSSRDEQTRELWLKALRISKPDFGQWCDENGHKRPMFWFGKDPGLDQSARSKGGARRGYDRGLQEFVNYVRDKLRAEGKKLTLGTLTDWLCENATPDEPYQPEITDCDNVYTEGGIISWKDGSGNFREHPLRILERYIRRAKTA